MRRIVRPLLLTAALLLVPIVPFLVAGDRLEAWTLGWFDPPPARWLTAMLTAGVLATDIFLPVPSSVVGTLAGAQLGIAAATAAIWIGLTVGGVIGFALARRWGRPLARRFCSQQDIDACDRTGRRFGGWLVAATRALPVLAEATVLLLGTTDLDWRRFLGVLALSNLGLAATYAALGSLARQQDELPLALAASMALPLVATAFVRWRWTRQATVEDRLPDGPRPAVEGDRRPD
jgi:uncharacterized membrane protein YdjX (TVP38/TMEM64 family)